jgi:hypothetical protein
MEVGLMGLLPVLLFAVAAITAFAYHEALTLGRDK